MALLGTLILFSLASAVWSYPYGAPPESCDNMAPSTAARPMGHGGPPQTRPSEFNVAIDVDANGWMPNTEYNISITKTNSTYDDIEGFLCQVRSSASGTTRHGSFVNLPNFYKNAPCATGSIGSATHTVALYNASASMTWRSPAASVPGSLTAYCTIVQHTSIYWVKVPSNSFQQNPSSIVTSSPTPPAATPPAATPPAATPAATPTSDAAKVTAGSAIVLSLAVLHKISFL